MGETKYQNDLVKKLMKLFPGAIITKGDPQQNQGFPDLIIFWRDRWAALEVKQSASSPQQPNQEYFVGTMNNMSFAAFIYPENERQVLDDLQQAFGSVRTARSST